ncbi:hypothetical protein FRC01_011846 [Tulasnella sp. 417]|nr:hypothetical protein FRC01_011846 [Tulasnella sp. 417]
MPYDGTLETDELAGPVDAMLAFFGFFLVPLVATRANMNVLGICLPHAGEEDIKDRLCTEWVAWLTFAVLLQSNIIANIVIICMGVRHKFRSWAKQRAQFKQAAIWRAQLDRRPASPLREPPEIGPLPLEPKSISETPASGLSTIVEYGRGSEVPDQVSIPSKLDNAGQAPLRCSGDTPPDIAPQPLPATTSMVTLVEEHTPQESNNRLAPLEGDGQLPI